MHYLAINSNYIPDITWIIDYSIFDFAFKAGKAACVINGSNQPGLYKNKALAQEFIEQYLTAAHFTHSEPKTLQ